MPPKSKMAVPLPVPVNVIVFLDTSALLLLMATKKVASSTLLLLATVSPTESLPVDPAKLMAAYRGSGNPMLEVYAQFN